MSTDEAVKAATRWPTSDVAATADALIVHGSFLAMVAQQKSDLRYAEYAALSIDQAGYSEAGRAWVESLAAVVTRSQVVIALAEVQKRSPEQADELARRLWVLTEDGGALHELTWEYLEARGVDPEAARRVVRAGLGIEVES